ncbi:hypothetical protein [Pseudacidovorax intermedius]|uniref:Nicotinamide riboside transporter PnuC n=1 Tax=Pseudacidovorax intermedius TaxID=433924 RepID=A0A147GW90_9BURK|nr:hypothetical protein [Pseudacidovorax intermedius]KTT21878.1 hypothetical protein NS331_10970 [Pseudacidovorax intermedius]
MTYLEWIETLGAVLGAAGALLLALNSRHAGWGFVLFLASNAVWWVFGRETGHWRLQLQHLVFSATSLIGIWRWLVQPRLDAAMQLLEEIKR